MWGVLKVSPCLSIYRHFQETGHTKFLELYSGQVWVFGKLDEHAGQQEVSQMETTICNPLLVNFFTFL